MPRLILLENSTGDLTVPQEILLDRDEVTLGRSATSTIILTSLQISRKHCSIVTKSSTYFILDHSTNGISLNNEKIPKNLPQELKENVQVGLVPTGTLIYKFETLKRKNEVVFGELDDQQKRPRYSNEIEKLSLEELRLKLGKVEGQLEVMKLEKLIGEEDRVSGVEEEVGKRIEAFREGFKGGFIEVLESEFGCCICSGVFVEPTTSPSCGHTYCHHCIMEWLKKKPECPICRAPILSAPLKHVEMGNFISRSFDIFGGDELTKRKNQLEERRTEVAAAAARPHHPQHPRLNPFEIFVELNNARGGGRGRGGRGRRGRGAYAQLQAGLPGGLNLHLFNMYQ